MLIAVAGTAETTSKAVASAAYRLRFKQRIGTVVAQDIVGSEWKIMALGKVSSCIP
jgi:hypothetical protein